MSQLALLLLPKRPSTQRRTLTPFKEAWPLPSWPEPGRQQPEAALIRSLSCSVVLRAEWGS